MGVSQVLRNLRKNRGLTLKQLHEESGLSISFISDIENERRNPSIETLESLAKALDVSVNVFFGDKSVNEHINNIKIEKPIQKSLPIIPEEFTNANEARAYIDKHQIFGSEGFDPDKLDDNEILEFANALLEQMKMVSYKYRK